MVVTGMSENWHGIDRDVVRGNLTDTDNTPPPTGDPLEHISLHLH
jgi:hypothetical protein